MIIRKKEQKRTIPNPTITQREKKDSKETIGVKQQINKQDNIAQKL